MLDDQDCTSAAIDPSTLLVAASQIREKEKQLEARRRTRHMVEHWDRREEKPKERRGRLEAKIEQLAKEKKSLSQRQTIASGAVRA